MTDDRSRKEQNADAREYEPPTVTPIGSVDELTAAATDFNSLDSAPPA